jgi:Tfp pilus assembly protein PilO
VTTFQRVLSEKQRIIYPLGLGAIVCALLYVLVVFPLSRQVANAEAGAQRQRELLRAARLEDTSAKGIVQGKQQADASLQKFYNDVLPPDASTARGITYRRLAQLARDSNLRLERGTNERKPEKDSALEKITTTYTLSGDYRDVRRFIYALETSPEFMILENIGLSSGEERERGLSVRLDVATYFRKSNGG